MQGHSHRQMALSTAPLLWDEQRGELSHHSPSLSSLCFEESKIKYLSAARSIAVPIDCVTSLFATAEQICVRKLLICFSNLQSKCT